MDDSVRWQRRMAKIELVTEIGATPERCFDLSRDIDLHLQSMAESGERAVAGNPTGLIGLGEEVAWLARHFGVTHRHTSRITAFDRPGYFRDSMVVGRVRRFEHDQLFRAQRLRHAHEGRCRIRFAVGVAGYDGRSAGPRPLHRWPHRQTKRSYQEGSRE